MVTRLAPFSLSLLPLPPPILNMTNSKTTVHKMVYKPDSMSTDEFILMINEPEQAAKWIAGDKTIALVDIVGSFDIFHSGQGAQGYLNRPSKQELEAVFETANTTSIAEIILTKGRLVSSEGLGSGGTKNDSQSGSFQTSRGAVGGGR